MSERWVECTAPVNIAVVKYWGKRDEQLVLPLHDSVSVTLSQQQLCAHTKVTLLPANTALPDQAGVCDEYAIDVEFWLNGNRQPSSAADAPRLHACLRELYRLASTEDSGGASAPHRLPPAHHRLLIESTNNFPTAAGLASSAAGFACVATAVARLYGVHDRLSAGQLSVAARLGSGSACRSMLGGFVRWRAGSRHDGVDSLAEQVAPAEHWPELRCLLLVVSDSSKATSSTVAMARTVATSQLMQHRLQSHVIGARVETMCQAIVDRDFAAFAALTMRDSNQMHAVCLDSQPPVVFMSDVSHAIARLVHVYNEKCGGGGGHCPGVCYTFDAGANACIYALQPHVADFVQCVRLAFGGADCEAGGDWLRGASVAPPNGDVEKLRSVVDAALAGRCMPGGVKYLIHTGVGHGPQIVGEQL